MDRFISRGRATLGRLPLRTRDRIRRLFFAKDLIENEFVVRARVIMSLSNMIALRDLLNDKIRSDQAGAASASAGATKH
jgi:hypothetical protein